MAKSDISSLFYKLARMSRDVKVLVLPTMVVGFVILCLLWGCSQADQPERRRIVEDEYISFLIGDAWEAETISGSFEMLTGAEFNYRGYALTDNDEESTEGEISISYPVPDWELEWIVDTFKPLTSPDSEEETWVVNGVEIRGYFDSGRNAYVMYYMDSRMPVKVVSSSREDAKEEAETIVNSLEVREAFQAGT